MTTAKVQKPQSADDQERNAWLVLIVICTAVFMLLLDTTIVNNAQVKIRLGLDANLTQIQWVLNSYILAYAVLLLSFGRLGDIFGRKRLFILGMSIFTIASGLCAASAFIGDAIGVSGVNVLIASRVLQGIGGAFMMPQSLTLVTVVFPPRKARRCPWHLGERGRSRRDHGSDHRRSHGHALRMGVGLPDQYSGWYRCRDCHHQNCARVVRSPCL